MMAEAPVPPLPGAGASVGATSGPGERPPVPAGQVLPATVQPPPANLPPNVYQLMVEGRAVLFRTSIPLRPGERLLLEGESSGGREGTSTRVLVRSGEAGGALEMLGPGRVRLAPGQTIPAALRSLMGGARIFPGEVLPFQHRGAVPLRVGGQIVRVQVEANVQPGDRLFVRTQEAGGALGLRALARGGPQSQAGPPGRAGLLEVAPRSVTARPPAPGEGARLTPGTLLTGVLSRISPPPGGMISSLLSSLPSFSAPPGAGAPGTTPGSGQAGGGAGGGAPGGGAAEGALPAQGAGALAAPPASLPAGGGAVGAAPPGAPAPPAAAGAGGQGSPPGTALLAFPGFDAEVPWPEAAGRDFAVGETVRVLVRSVEPRLELELLPPERGAASGARFVPPAGAGDRSFGARLAGLAEALGAARGQLAAGAPQAAAAEGLIESLEALVIRGGEVSAERLREAFERSGAIHRAETGGQRMETARPPDLRESLVRFLNAVRAGGEGNPLNALLSGAEQTLASVEFFQAANGIRQLLDQGQFLQLPYSLGEERGTMNIVVRRDGGGGGGKDGERRNYTAVLFLELEGLGPLRIDASLVENRVNVRFTTPVEPVGKFIEADLIKLKEGIESQDIGVDGISWILGRPQAEAIIPVEENEDLPEGDSYINLKV